jgi:hypothetical protein
MAIDKHFGLHPSTKLKALYQLNAHQGANPANAKIIFLGRHANWNYDIENDAIFPHVLEYLEDGTSFWEKYKVHHPFLLSDYKGDGRRYHRMFSKIGLNEFYKGEVSFIELLKFPTFGMAAKNRKEFLRHFLDKSNRQHLLSLDQLLQNKEKTIFIGWGLINDIKQLSISLDLFNIIKEIDLTKMDINSVNAYQNIFIHKSFSDSISNETLNKMREIIDLRTSN